MLDKINEIEIALENNLFQSALALTLTLPDICGLIEYPKKGVGERYISWFDNYVYKYYYKNDTSYDGVYEFTGEVCYQLRNKFLHEGHTHAYESNKIPIDSFELVDTRNSAGIPKYSTAYSDFAIGDEVETENIDFDRVNWHSEKLYGISIDISYFCTSICNAAKSYYNSKDDKSLFKNQECIIIKV